ncbi:MAG TPA: hypothetical protein IAA29_04355 [Candidatus Paenibacillus intestinavium]|nr:hypothetical protein [Candidatus Paenibacillus intestinavium]
MLLIFRLTTFVVSFLFASRMKTNSVTLINLIIDVMLESVVVGEGLQQLRLLLY